MTASVLDGLIRGVESAVCAAFTVPPTDVGEAWIAVFDDTCGNLIQIISVKP